MTAPANTRVGRLSQLDRSVVLKLQSACNFINGEVRRVRNKVLTAVAIFTAIGVVAWIVLSRNQVDDPRVPLAIIVIPSIWYWRREHKALNRTYKSIVVKRAVAALGEGMMYSPDSRFGIGDFNGMDLFQKKAEQWEAEDEITGRKNVVTYTLLEAKATRVEGSGKNRRTVTIFKGLIVRLDFNKNFRTHTVVVPDNDSLGLFGESDSRGMKDIANMDSVEFEKCFSVYCTDQQEARYLLTPKLMELLLDANRTLGGRLRASFQDNHLYLTIPSSKDRFNVHIFQTNVTPELVAGELAEVIGLAEQLVDTLDLETRIWSRV